MERAGIPTALLCNLVAIAQQMGVPRIVATRGIPYPTGDPELDPKAERQMRKDLMEAALIAVSSSVTGPTVFDATGPVA